MTDAELRALAEKATPGPWKAWLREDYDAERFLSYRQHTVIGKGELGYWSTIGGSYDKDREDAALIAACSPDRILALLDRIATADDRNDAVSEQNEVLRTSLTRAEEAIQNIRDHEMTQDTEDFIDTYDAQVAPAALPAQPKEGE